MKMMKGYQHLVIKLFSALGFFSVSVFAQAQWIHDTEVVDVRWYDNYGYITVSDDENPGCPGAAPTDHKRLNVTNPGHEKIISLALSAMMAEKKISLLVSGCHGGQYSLIRGVVVKR